MKRQAFQNINKYWQDFKFCFHHKVQPRAASSGWCPHYNLNCEDSRKRLHREAALAASIVRRIFTPITCSNQLEDTMALSSIQRWTDSTR